ncbi:MAG: hypothetical protein RL846_45575 [Deltaproteobacteria bacterium]
MSPSLSWIDEDTLASSLTRAGVSTLPISTRPSSTPRFYDPPTLTRAPVPPITPYPNHPPSSVEATPLPETKEGSFNDVTASTDAAEEPNLDAPSVWARIEALSAWLAQVVGDDFYIADPEGLPIAVTKSVEDLVVSGVALERAIRSLRGITKAPSVGAASNELDADRTLDTIWCDTPVGRIAVGVVGTKPLSKSVVTSIRRYIARTFDWKES